MHNLIPSARYCILTTVVVPLENPNKEAVHMGILVTIAGIVVFNFVVAPSLARFIFRRETPQQEAVDHAHQSVFCLHCAGGGLRTGVRYSLYGEER
jgi:hypothetical protein